jgi:hypothetical protein
MKQFIQDILKDEKGNYSSKRFLGILCVLTLLFSLVVTTFTNIDTKPSDTLVNAVALFAFGSLGLTSLDKWSSSNGLK